MPSLLDAVPGLGRRDNGAPNRQDGGVRSWAEFYDEPGNQLIDPEQPIVREILDGLARCVALDAACRHSAYLESLGHTVIGVDSSAAMLNAHAKKVPDGEFHEADLHDLTSPDDHVDLVVCALALVHARTLSPCRPSSSVSCPAAIW